MRTWRIEAPFRRYENCACVDRRLFRLSAAEGDDAGQIPHALDNVTDADRYANGNHQGFQNAGTGRKIVALQNITERRCHGKSGNKRHNRTDDHVIRLERNIQKMV